MPSIRNHNNCCGIYHLAGFYNFNGRGDRGEGDQTVETLTRTLGHINFTEGPRSRGKLVEAVITDGQFRTDPTLASTLKSLGFRIVDRFHNSTGGMCNVLHRTSGRRDIKRSRASWVRTLRED